MNSSIKVIENKNLFNIIYQYLIRRISVKKYNSVFYLIIVNKKIYNKYKHLLTETLKCLLDFLFEDGNIIENKSITKMGNINIPIRYMYLYCAKLTNIPFIENIGYLTISDTNISSDAISNIYKLKGLIRLTIISSNLTELPLLNIPKLFELNLLRNKIENKKNWSIDKFLKGIPKIRDLDLSYNLIENFKFNGHKKYKFNHFRINNNKLSKENIENISEYADIKNFSG